MQIINVMAVSLDGRIASHPDEPDTARRALGFTNDDDREHLRQLLLTADAVICGSSSLMASGGAWELANGKGVFPIWAVLTNRGLPESAAFFRQRRITRWLVSQGPLALPAAAAGTRNLVYADKPAAVVIRDELAAAGCERVLLFGGGEVNRAFYAAGAVDQLIVTVCPLILGNSTGLPLVAPALSVPVKLSLMASEPKGNLVFLTYHVTAPDLPGT